jgi:hypothetical protein
LQKIEATNLGSRGYGRKSEKKVALDAIQGISM